MTVYSVTLPRGKLAWQPIVELQLLKFLLQFKSILHLEAIYVSQL